MSSARTQRSCPAGVGRAKQRYRSGPSAGTVKEARMCASRSGLPNCHPSWKTGGAGVAAGLPCGAPAAAQRASRAISGSVNLRACAKAGSDGSHGGIKRLPVTVAISAARLATSGYAMSEKGPTPPGRWQTTHSRYRIGATSWENVTPVCPAKNAASRPTIPISLLSRDHEGGWIRTAHPLPMPCAPPGPPTESTASALAAAIDKIPAARRSAGPPRPAPEIRCHRE